MVRRKGGRSEELPLPADAGQAIADYLTIRPAVRDTRAVFISACAPRRPVTRSTVTLLVKSHCKAAGTPGRAHLLRHTLASDLLGPRLAAGDRAGARASQPVRDIAIRQGRPGRPGQARAPVARRGKDRFLMGALTEAAQQYLRLRRALGYELEEPGKLVLSFAEPS